MSTGQSYTDTLLKIFFFYCGKHIYFNHQKCKRTFFCLLSIVCVTFIQLSVNACPVLGMQVCSLARVTAFLSSSWGTFCFFLLMDGCGYFVYSISGSVGIVSALFLLRFNLECIMGLIY